MLSNGIKKNHPSDKLDPTASDKQILISLTFEIIQMKERKQE